MGTTKTEINIYLAYEWGLYDEGDPPREDRPFGLEFCGRTNSQLIYRFDDETGEPHYAGITGEGEARTFWAVSTGGMAFEDFTDALRGSDWLYSQDRVDLCPERIHGGKPPRRLHKQRAVIEDLARQAFGPRLGFEVLEGYQFRELDKIIALVRAKRSGKTLLVGVEFEPIDVGWPEASAGFRMGLAIARHVMDPKEDMGSGE